MCVSIYTLKCVFVIILALKMRLSIHTFLLKKLANLDPPDSTFCCWIFISSWARVRAKSTVAISTFLGVVSTIMVDYFLRRQFKSVRLGYITDGNRKKLFQLVFSCYLIYEKHRHPNYRQPIRKILRNI